MKENKFKHKVKIYKYFILFKSVYKVENYKEVIRVGNFIFRLSKKIKDGKDLIYISEQIEEDAGLPKGSVVILDFKLFDKEK